MQFKQLFCSFIFWLAVFGYPDLDEYNNYISVDPTRFSSLTQRDYEEASLSASTLSAVSASSSTVPDEITSFSQYQFVPNTNATDIELLNAKLDGIDGIMYDYIQEHQSPQKRQSNNPEDLTPVTFKQFVKRLISPEPKEQPRKHQLKKRHLISENQPNIVKEFNSMKHLLQSNFFRNPNRTRNVYAKLKGDPNYYEVLSNGKTPDKIVVREVHFGKGKSASMLNKPITKCAYAHGNDSDLTLSKSNSYAQKFALLHGIQVSHQYEFDLLTGVFETINNGLESFLGWKFMNHTINWSVGVERDRELSTTHSFGGSIDCNSGKGGVTQIFSNIRYRYFPEAEVRYHFFDAKRKPSNPQAEPKHLSTTEWNHAYSSEDYPQYGLVLYDNSKGAEYACVNDPKYLQCDAELDVVAYDPHYNPVAGLNLALAKG